MKYISHYYTRVLDKNNKYIIFEGSPNDEYSYIAFRYNRGDEEPEINSATYTIIYYNDLDYEIMDIPNSLNSEYRPDVYENVKVYNKEAFGESFRGYSNGRLDVEIIILFLLELLLVPISLVFTIINIIIFIISHSKKAKRSIFN